MDWWRSLVSYIPLSFLEMTWDQFFETFLDRFLPYSLRDQLRDDFDYLEQGFMVVAEYDARFHALFRYSYVSFSTEFENIQKFVKGLDVSL